MGSRVSKKPNTETPHSTLEGQHPKPNDKLNTLPNSLKSQLLNSDEAIEAIEEILETSNKDQLHHNLQVFMANNYLQFNSPHCFTTAPNSGHRRTERPEAFDDKPDSQLKDICLPDFVEEIESEMESRHSSQNSDGNSTGPLQTNRFDCATPHESEITELYSANASTGPPEGKDQISTNGSNSHLNDRQDLNLVQGIERKPDQGPSHSSTLPQGFKTLNGKQLTADLSDKLVSEQTQTSLQLPTIDTETVINNTEEATSQTENEISQPSTSSSHQIENNDKELKTFQTNSILEIIQSV